MFKNKTALKEAIEEFLISKGNFDDLKPKDQRFLLHALTEFVDNAANKFIAGGIEHADSDFLDECDHGVEIQKELIDGWMYSSAQQYNKMERAKRSVGKKGKK